MKELTPEMAKALLSLIHEVDENHSDTNPDWCDSVCTAREALPEGTLEALSECVGSNGAV